MDFRLVSASLAATTCLLLGLFVYARAPSRPINRYFFLFNIGLSIWALGDLFVAGAYRHQNHGMALIFDRFSYLGATMVVPFFMLQLDSLTNWRPTYWEAA